MTLRAILTFSVAAVLTSACATKPDIIEEVVPVAETAPEVFRPAAPEAAPLPPVVQQPTRQAFAPPTPGSLQDFLYQSGGDARIYFGYDQNTLSNEARDVLRRQASWLNSYSNVTAVIEGNADERGTREYNLALGARRANSVKAFLVSQGVAPSRLTTVSYGKERPIEGGSDEYSWSRNRNAHTNVNVSNTFG
jgi:peptidoglycan-associated lipoprotein